MRHRNFKCAAVLVIALGSIAITRTARAAPSAECLTEFEPIVSEAGLDAISNALGKFATASGSITFKSSTLLEDIASTNRSVASAFDLATGRMVFLIDMDKFEFKKSLMGEHFRGKNFLDVEKFPQASFVGQIDHPEAIDPSASGVQRVKIRGMMTIHGVSKNVTIDGSLKRDGRFLKGSAKFHVDLDDYNVDIPAIQQAMISTDIEVDVQMSYEQVKQ